MDGPALALILARQLGLAEGKVSEALLTRIVTEARAQWPGVELAPEVFVRRLGEVLAPEKPLDQALAAIRAGELYLATACAARDRRAIAAIEARFVAGLPAYLRATSDSPERIADALQTLRTRLFGEGKIAEYAGRGSLEGWLRVAAQRTVLDLADKDKRLLPTDEPEREAELVSGDPELEFIKGRYREDFHAAFRAALDQLSREERNVLRLHVIDGLNVAEIGAVINVHRATVARWIAAARSKILISTRAGLATRLATSPDELASMMQLLGSQLDRSLHTFLIKEKA